MDQTRFNECVNYVYSLDSTTNGIGTLREKTIHSVLKYYYGNSLSDQEKRINSYIADVFVDNKIYEIQTRSFDKLRNKLDCFLKLYEVNLVYPISQVKYIKYIDTETLASTKTRKSSKKGSIYLIVKELYKIRKHLTNPNLKIIMPLLHVEEIRMEYDNKLTKVDKFPIALLDEVILDSVDDYLKFIPEELSLTFKSDEFAKKAKISRNIAQTLLLILTDLNLVTRVGKDNRSYLYQINKGK